MNNTTARARDGGQDLKTFGGQDQQQCQSMSPSRCAESLSVCAGDVACLRIVMGNCKRHPLECVFFSFSAEHASRTMYLHMYFYFSFRPSVPTGLRQTSVDPKKAKSGIGSLYSALITSFTASTYHPAGQIALGLHVGTLLKVRGGVCRSSVDDRS